MANNFGKFSKIYPFATENVGGYMAKLDFRGKNVLSVCGSCDQAVNAYLAGAKEVVLFDLNFLSAFFADLKLAAIKSMEFEEFKKFFFRFSESGRDLNKSALNFEIYSNLRPDLNQQSRSFFDSCYLRFDFDGFAFRNSGIFNNSYDLNHLKIKINPYLQSEAKYLAAKDAVGNKSVLWLQSDVIELEKNLPVDEKFDLVLLSNISDYAKSIFEGNENYLELFCNSIVSQLRPHLTENGGICAAYVYDIRNMPCGRQAFRTDIDDPFKRDAAFQNCGMQYSEIVFESVIPEKNDGIILLNNR